MTVQQVHKRTWSEEEKERVRSRREKGLARESFALARFETPPARYRFRNEPISARGATLFLASNTCEKSVETNTMKPVGD